MLSSNRWALCGNILSHLTASMRIIFVLWIEVLNLISGINIVCELHHIWSVPSCCSLKLWEYMYFRIGYHLCNQLADNANWSFGLLRNIRGVFSCILIMMKMRNELLGSFYKLWPSMEHHEPASINPQPHSEACFRFELVLIRGAHTHNERLLRRGPKARL